VTGTATENGWRLSAAEIEQTVASVAVALLRDQNVIVTAAEHSNIEPGRLSSVLKYVRALIERLQSASQSDPALREVVERVQLSATAIRLSLAIRLPEQGGPAPDIISLTKDFPMKIKRRSVEMRMVLAGESDAVRFDRSLLRAVGRTRRRSQQLLSGQFPSIGGIARKERIAPRYIRDLMPLAFLSPKIVKAIVEGRNYPSSASPDESISRSFGPHNSRYSVLATRFDVSPPILPKIISCDQLNGGLETGAAFVAGRRIRHVLSSLDPRGTRAAAPFSNDSPRIP
jgi:hypothetical protein